MSKAETKKMVADMEGILKKEEDERYQREILLLLGYLFVSAEEMQSPPENGHCFSESELKQRGHSQRGIRYYLDTIKSLDFDKKQVVKNQPNKR